ncbi:MAG: site-2 protease family protein [Firmicutes bacterium]|nr:site-2 protease family protein [Bacillota bacterium]
MFRGNSLEQILLSVPALLIAITFHEFAHGYVAYRLGDPTAKNYGRLTLNPVKHLDPLGAITLLLVGFGWAKPVPVDPAYFRNPKKGMALVGLAGPAANIIIAFLTLVLAAIFEINLFRGTGYLAGMMIYTIFLNIGLAVFNLIPIPPLDGSKIFSAFLPPKIYFGIMRYERYAHVILLLLLFTGILTPFLVFLQRIVLNALILIVNVLPL